jgi:hypothetical protein
MRAEFWNVFDPTIYNVRLSPLTQLPPVTINVPAVGGGTGGLSAQFNGICGPVAIVNANLIDSVLRSQFPQLAAQGVGASTLPMFMFYNTFFAQEDPTNRSTPTASGYHSALAAVENSSLAQTYVVTNFDTTGIFGAGFMDTATASHELAEWMNDPLGTNLDA